MSACRVGILVLLLAAPLTAAGCTADRSGPTSDPTTSPTSDPPSYRNVHAERRSGPMHRSRSRSLHVIGQSPRALPGGTAAKPEPTDDATEPQADITEAEAEGEGEGEGEGEAVEGFAVETLTEGSGPKASTGSSVTLRLHGRLEDGTTFQQREEPAGPWPVHRLMPGLARTIDGMAVGERRRVTIPPSLAYGDREIIDRDTGEVLIPAGATLVYDVELVAIESRGESDVVDDAKEEDD
ncbi:MAG: FKBP-type peptidyl-prolyl cis-trans isomerase, partial [Phycisphaeraceae bacterium]